VRIHIQEASGTERQSRLPEVNGPPGGRGQARSCRGRALVPTMLVMSIAEFRDSDSDYLGWVAAHGDGYVVNIGRSGRG